jgi:outer membrane lipoprotein carrier protein
VYDKHSHVVQISSGKMLIQKPGGKFRCDYLKPSKQVIIADGNRLWAYDVALAQVTVRKLDKALSLAAPMVLLSGNTPLEEAFIIGKPYEKDGLTWYKLESKQQRVEFSSLRVAFDDDLLCSLEIEDEAGQHTFIDFQKLELNPAIDPSLLNFIPPPGVDVVGD